MRNLFFMLALANVLFFGWQYAVRDRTEPGVEVVPTSSLKDNVELVQTAEATAPAEENIATLDTEPAPPPKTLAAAVGPRCLTVGPFTKVAEANAALAALKAGGSNVAQRATQGTELVGHWVYVDNIPTRQAARSLVAKLREGGIKDASLYAGKRGEDLISLGIFRSLSGAERIELQSESMGIEANMTKKTRNTTVFYLDVRLSEGQDSGDFADSYGEERVFLGDAATCPGSA